jgi:hypothetical protein
MRPRIFAVAFGLMLALSPLSALAQSSSDDSKRTQVISANPFGLLLEFFNAEYEREFAEAMSVGFGGSFLTQDGDSYLNADVFARFYPQGKVFDGWAFGSKLGLTNVPDQGTYFGFGFDVNRSWLMGPSDNFYVGVGFGLKRLLGASDANFDTRFIPTIRIINVGLSF